MKNRSSWNTDDYSQSRDSPTFEPHLQTIVEVLNPNVGDHLINQIAIGRSMDCSSLDDSFSYHNIDRNDKQRPLSLNDKMKTVLKELLDNERVKTNLSRSLIADDNDNVDGNSSDDDPNENKTKFFVREKLINDFFTYNTESDNPLLSSNDNCQVYQNPNIDFTVEVIEAELEKVGIEDEKIKEKLLSELNVAERSASGSNIDEKVNGSQIKKKKKKGKKKK